jgi:DNA-binding NarL/FixJ family response regulator
LEHTKTILICEDEPALRELVRASLDGGYRFAEASDGYVALKLAQELVPDAVILDLMLPGLSGLDAKMSDFAILGSLSSRRGASRTRTSSRREQTIFSASRSIPTC